MRKKSRTLLLLSWIHDLLLFEGIYVLATAVQGIRGREVTLFLLKGLIMLLPVALSYIVICKCRNLWFFLIFSLASIWFMKTISQSLLTGCLTAFVFLFRCYVKLKQGEIRRKMKELPNEAGAQEDKEIWEVPTLLDAPRVPHCLIFVIMYLGILYLHRYALLNLMLGILAAELCICLAYCYLERLDGFVENNSRVANLPAGAMKKIGSGILLTGITGLILFLLPAAIYHEEPLAKLRFEPSDMNSVVEYYEENSEPDYMMAELMRLKTQAKKTPKWLETASEITALLTVLLITYLALRLIFMALKKAMESFSDDEDEIIFLENGDDNREKVKGLLKRTARDHFRSPEMKIRRLYKKLIKRALPENPYGSETPLELENKADLYEKKTDEMCQIHELYEKARYGKNECTKEEAKHFADLYSSKKSW